MYFHAEASDLEYLASLSRPENVDVRIVITHENTSRTIVRFTNTPLSAVEEAVAHINDNSGGN